MNRPLPAWKVSSQRRTIRDAILRFEESRDAHESYHGDVNPDARDDYEDEPAYKLATSEYLKAWHRLEATMLFAGCRVAVLDGKIYIALTEDEHQESQQLGRIDGRVIDLDAEPTRDPRRVRRPPEIEVARQAVAE